MIRITLQYGGTEKKLLVPEMKKLRDVLNEADIAFSPEDHLIIGDRTLSGDELDKNLIDLGLAGSPELTARIEYDLPWDTRSPEEALQGSVIYPPKARVIGCACIIFSAFTLDLLRDYQRYFPEALVRRDEKGDPVFAISLDESSPGSLNEFGAVFSRHTTKSGNPTITILIDPDCDDPEEAVRNSLGPAILNLVEMEETLTTRYHELQERKDLLDLHISRA